MADYFYCSLGALLFSLYIIFDTYMIVNRLDQEEYILGAIDLYAPPPPLRSALVAARGALTPGNPSRVGGCGGGERPRRGRLRRRQGRGLCVQRRRPAGGRV